MQLKILGLKMETYDISFIDKENDKTTKNKQKRFSFQRKLEESYAKNH